MRKSSRNAGHAGVQSTNGNDPKGWGSTLPRDNSFGSRALLGCQPVLMIVRMRESVKFTGEEPNFTGEERG
jgi:hypothetical protein